MPRPIKCRRVCTMPVHCRFGPLGTSESCLSVVNMTVDEYEVIRLIDEEKLTQQECSVRMQVARTTVQAIYDSARAKIAECLVHGKSLVIEGGAYRLCAGRCSECHKGRCPQSGMQIKATLKKKIRG